MSDLIVYSRAGCHLCDDLLEILAPLCRAAGKSWQVVDVDNDPVLTRRYGLDVPVVTDGESVVMRHRFDRAAWDDWLTGRQ